MNRVVVFQKIAGGQVEIVRPVPWARMVSRINSEVFNPPKRLEQVSIVRNIDAYLTLLDAIQAGTAQVDWAETEDQFCQRIIDEETDEMETPAQTQARIAGATNFRDTSPFPQKTGNKIRKTVPLGATVFIVDANTIPTDRKTRNAFKLNRLTQRVENAPPI